ncbi:transcriptional regulator, LysR family [Geomicrobium sp. JCM 19037]|uniref:LysR family transcriptional regulator n=1 Tax=Geomicrobium sp. JCM 19037 TaxID=1460634 RepID=UPI00045F27D5|nr:LysR family transcriptional regulator [Geomicrobium sp. JCM 19037]GAK03870.1 transcriptional regulator, LysR family [Geomicrobium sp. JCM 19037]
MDTKRLRYFKTIADEGQITRAARKLQMAQPPLSQQLKLLEEELNVQLFDRGKRSLQLTAAGAALYEKAKIILGTIEDTVHEIKAMDSGEMGTLSIGVNKSCFYYLLEPMGHIRANTPNVKIQLREGDTYTLMQAMAERDIEVAFVRFPLNIEDFTVQYDAITLPAERYVLAVSTTHARSIEGVEVQMQHLSGIPLLLLHRTSGRGQYERVIGAFHRAGVQPNIACECPDAAMLLSLALAGIGAAIVPESTLQAFPTEGLQVFPIANMNVKAEAAIVWQRERYLSGPTRRMLERMRGIYRG